MKIKLRFTNSNGDRSFVYKPRGECYIRLCAVWDKKGDDEPFLVATWSKETVATGRPGWTTFKDEVFTHIKWFCGPPEGASDEENGQGGL